MPFAAKPSPGIRLLVFLALACLLSWPLWLAVIASSRGWIRAHVQPSSLGSFGPTVAALVLTFWWQGRSGARELLRRLARWRVDPKLYTFALLADPVLVLAAAGAAQLSGSPIPARNLGKWYLVAPIFAAILVFGGPLGEEIGWRGYALPLLLRRQGPFLASLGTGLMWLFWHLPLFWMPGSAQQGIPIAYFGVALVSYSVLLTWLYNRSGGSLLLALLFHTAHNTALLLAPAVFPHIDERPVFYETYFYLTCGLALALLVLARREFFAPGSERHGHLARQAVAIHPPGPEQSQP